jgi:hypothetical protein
MTTARILIRSCCARQREASVAIKTGLSPCARHARATINPLDLALAERPIWRRDQMIARPCRSLGNRFECGLWLSLLRATVSSSLEGAGRMVRSSRAAAVDTLVRAALKKRH